jgi:hypothetical protein
VDSLPPLPHSLEDAVDQAIVSLGYALDGGVSRILLDLRFDELKPLPVAYGLAVFLRERFGTDWQVLFADAGMAALARRDWADLEVSMRGVNEGRSAIRAEDRAFLLVAPSAIEVDRLERLLALAGDRPFILFNPRLESAEVGIGLTARRLRERFINSFTVVYYLQPLAQGALFRAYPQGWQVWQTPEMVRVYGGNDRPSGEEIDNLFRVRTGKGSSWLSRLQGFITALRS